MSFYIHIQDTPNPNAVKFISRYTVKADGSSNYHTPDEAVKNPLAQKIFGMPGVMQVYFFDNYITVTKDPTVTWTDIGDDITALLQEELPDHNPNYLDPGESADKVQDRSDLPPEIREVEEILDRTVRDYLAMDGGDITVIERKGNMIFFQFQGSCGSCPISSSSTLQAIKSVLREELGPDIECVDVGSGGGAEGEAEETWW